MMKEMIRTEIPALAPRSDFPVLREVNYLNTASIGLIPLPVQFEGQAFDREISSRGTTWFDEDEETGVLERARTGASRLLNTATDQIAIVPSASEALSQIAWWLRPAAGTNIVSIDMEHPTVTFPWWRVAEDTGAEMRLVQAFDDPAGLSVDSVAAVVDEQTSVIAVSHVQYSNGTVLDLGELSELARAYDAKLVIDATQSAGMVPIDLEQTRVDALVAGGYKRLCGPFGAAILAVGEELLQGLRPPLAGWRCTPTPYDFDARVLQFASSARMFEFSTMSYVAGHMLGGAIEYVLDLGVERILEHDRALAQLLIDGLEERGAEIITPRQGGIPSGTVGARFPGLDGERVAVELSRAGVVVSPRFASTRFALHFFNDGDDVVRALDTLDVVLAELRA